MRLAVRPHSVPALSPKSGLHAIDLSESVPYTEWVICRQLTYAYQAAVAITSHQQEVILNRKAIIMHASDDVATALVDLTAGERVLSGIGAETRETQLRENVEFAHKYALRDIAAGEPILKYGMPIGRALNAIKAGEWVHVHNCRSDSWGYQNEKYGLKA